MPPALRLSRLLIAVACCVVLSAPAAAREPDPGSPTGSLHEVPLPGGVRAALEALGLPGTPDRSHFLLDVIRRHHHQTLRRTDAAVERGLATLLAHLDRASGAGDGHAAETVPLPLAPRIWIDVVFEGRATEDTLVASILRSRDASLLYHGLLSLDHDTRAWLAERPHTIGRIVSRSAALFAAAAPGIRVRDGVIQLPGGAAAAPAWEAIVGRSPEAPEEFLSALLAPGQGRTTYFVWALSHLTAPQLEFALALDAVTPAVRVDAARRLLAIFERLGWDWKIDDRPFWRPPVDPALLVAELAAGGDGRPRLPGTNAFWQLAFADRGRRLTRPVSDRDARGTASEPPVDFLWLCEQIFDGPSINPEGRYRLVLFASRILEEVTSETAHEAVEALRAVRAYPALASAIERAGIRDPAVFAATGRRAADLARIRSRTIAHRSLAQFQGALALLTRAASRSTAPKEATARAILSLAAVETNARGDYEGRLVRWLDAYLRDAAAGGRPGAAGATAAERLFVQDDAHDVATDALLRHVAAGAFTLPLAVVDWEGTRYRVDLAHGELVRIDQLLGPAARPYASVASALVRLADALDGDPGPEVLAERAAVLEGLAQKAGWGGRPPGFVAALRRHARSGDGRAAARLSPEIRLAADDLLGRGLLELTYAVALGQPERVLISAPEAAARHGFGLDASDWRPLAAWQPPLERQDPGTGWHVSGSVLGLDVRLAAFSVLQLSSMPPPQRPTLNDQDRRAIIETIPLIEPGALADADRDAIVSALQRGRVRLAGLDTAREAIALADDVRMSPTKRSLLPWAVVHDRDNAPRFLSAGDLLWLGLDAIGPDRLHAWGAPARPRFGCLCLRVTAPRSEEIYWGRWHAGLRMSTFPDLNLRLAELLAELQMPAPLLGPVLAPAVLDFVNLVESPDPDDRRGLITFVQDLRVDQIEQYLAALTTDGPLVPVSHTAAPARAGTDRGESEAP